MGSDPDPIQPVGFGLGINSRFHVLGWFCLPSAGPVRRIKSFFEFSMQTACNHDFPSASVQCVIRRL